MSPPPLDYLARAEWLGERMNERDTRILETILAVRMMTGEQIERLFFAGLVNPLRARAKVMQRLVRMRAVLKVDRRIGGFGGGSSPSAYVCDASAIAYLYALRGDFPDSRPQAATRIPARLRRHVLAVSEFYTRLQVTARESGDFSVLRFQTEPECWWPVPGDESLKPDAYAVIANDTHEEHWWIEIDLGTESPAAILAKLTRYLMFARSGEQGPEGAIPRVLMSVPDAERERRINRIVQDQPPPAGDLFLIKINSDSVALLPESLTFSRIELERQAHTPWHSPSHASE